MKFYSVKFKDSAIIHLDTSKNSGSHWVSHTENDSFGNLKPKQEVVKHFGDLIKIL